MKVLQTLGRHGSHPKGIFQYKRSATVVTIDASIGLTQLEPVSITLTTAEWTAILTAIETSEQNSFRLALSTLREPPPPHQSLYDTITQAVPSPMAGWSWNDAWRAYVCAILEHEGSIDLYYGALGPEHAVFIPLARDIP
jgi:hypothetical protein